MCQGADFGLWRFWDMATGADDVPNWDRTGSLGCRAKATRLTQRGSRRDKAQNEICDLVCLASAEQFLLNLVRQKSQVRG